MSEIDLVSVVYGTEDNGLPYVQITVGDIVDTTHLHPEDTEEQNLFRITKSLVRLTNELLIKSSILKRSK